MKCVSCCVKLFFCTNEGCLASDESMIHNVTRFLGLLAACYNEALLHDAITKCYVVFG